MKWLLIIVYTMHVGRHPVVEHRVMNMFDTRAECQRALRDSFYNVEFDRAYCKSVSAIYGERP